MRSYFEIMGWGEKRGWLVTLMFSKTYDNFGNLSTVLACTAPKITVLGPLSSEI